MARAGDRGADGRERGGVSPRGGRVQRGDSNQGGRTTAIVEFWTYREQSFGSIDLAGYKVEATDGEIGKVDEASNDVGSSYIVVDTGPWIFGKTVMLPAGVVKDIDLDTETVVVDRSKEEIKNSPEFDPETYRDNDYRGELGDYYGNTRRG